MDYTEAGYKIYGLWCEAGRPGTPEWGVSSIANIIRELDSKVIEPVTQAAPVSPRQEWISVDERLPETNGMYLITPGKYQLVEIYYLNKARDWIGRNDIHRNVTHWMPLPELPIRDSVTLTPPSKDKA